MLKRRPKGPKAARRPPSHGGPIPLWSSVAAPRSRPRGPFPRHLRGGRSSLFLCPFPRPSSAGCYEVGLGYEVLAQSSSAPCWNAAGPSPANEPTESRSLTVWRSVLITLLGPLSWGSGLSSDTPPSPWLVPLTDGDIGGCSTGTLVRTAWGLSPDPALRGGTLEWALLERGRALCAWEQVTAARSGAGCLGPRGGPGRPSGQREILPHLPCRRVSGSDVQVAVAAALALRISV